MRREKKGEKKGFFLKNELIHQLIKNKQLPDYG